MEIPSFVTKVKFYGDQDDLDIYIQQFYFKTSEIFWQKPKEKVKKGVNILCLCNWKSFNSSLHIMQNKYIGISLTQLHTNKGPYDHMHVSVSKHGVIKQLKDLCLEMIDVHDISIRKIRKFTYLKENNLLESKTMKLYLSTLEGNEIRSCKNTMIRCDLNI
jgi:hypothetical protein